MNKEQINITFIEDHPMFSESVAFFLQLRNPLFNINYASNGLDFINQLKTMKFVPDITVIDINMPVMDGRETVLWMKSNNIKSKKLILTQNIGDYDIIEFLTMGVDGYLNKGLSINELGLAIRIIANGGQYYCDDVKKVRDKNIKLMNGGRKGTVKLVKGTTFNVKELTILKLACKGLANKEVSKITGIPVRTIDGYIERIYKKTNTNSRIKLLAYAMKNKLTNH
jgi:DNA-binding NarL/FixJ family response regulator